MKVNVRHFGKVINGKRVYNNLELHRQQLLQLEGKDFEEVIKERSKRVTLDQFSFYYGGILPTCYNSETFSHYDNHEEIHEEYFAPKFLKYTKQVNSLDGTKKESVKYRSLSDLNRKEMSEFIEKVLIETELLGIHVLTSEEYKNKIYNL